MVYGYLRRQCTCVVAAKERAAVRVHADAEVTDSNFKLGASDYVGYCICDSWIYLRSVEDGRVGEVVEGYEEDARDAGRG